MSNNTKKPLKPLSYPLGKIATNSFQSPATESSPKKAIEKGVPYPATKITLEVSAALLEKIRDYAHWEGMTQKEAVAHALDSFFEANQVESRPEIVKKREFMRMQQDKRRRKINQ